MNQSLKDYLKNKHMERKTWAKCYIKNKFTCGMVTSSRIESKHNVYKKYLNGNSRLSELYLTFQNLENIEIKNYSNEINKFTIKQNQELEKYKLISESKLLYGPYIIERLKISIIKALKYSIKSNNQNNIW